MDGRGQKNNSDSFFGWLKCINSVYPKPQIKEIWYTFKGDNTVTFALLPSEKGSTLKEKNLLPFQGEQIPFF